MTYREVKGTAVAERAGRAKRPAMKPSLCVIMASSMDFTGDRPVFEASSECLWTKIREWGKWRQVAGTWVVMGASSALRDSIKQQ